MSLNSETINRDYPWLTRDLLENNLRKKYEDDRIEVIEFEATPALGPGENYASVVIRIHLQLRNFKTDTMNIILKANHVREDLAEAVKEMDIFGKEIYFYKEILNRVHTMLRDAGITVKLGAEMIANDSNPSYVMFEDLKPLGFKVMNKYKGLDFNHLKMTMTKIGYWHAATAVLGESDPQLMDTFRETMHTDENGPFVIAMVKMYELLGKEVNTWKGFEEIGDKIRKLAPIIINRGKGIYTAPPGDFNVLNHGDMWLSNIMYKHDETSGRLDDVVMVDYSIGFWGNQGLDISYYLFGSSADNVTEENWDDLLMHYYTTLVYTLKALNYTRPIPRFFDVYMKYLNAAQSTCFVAILVAAIRQLVDGSQGTLANFLDDTPQATNFRQTLLTNPNFRVSAERLLKYYNRKGLLD